MDLKGTYTLLSFRAEDVGLFAMLLTDDLIYFEWRAFFWLVWDARCVLSGDAGHHGDVGVQHALHSRTVMYVDDTIGVGMLSHIEEDLGATRRICTDLQESGAVADDKMESGRRIDIIGYVIHLDTDRVLISRKNCFTRILSYRCHSTGQPTDCPTSSVLGHTIWKNMQSDAPFLFSASQDHVGAHGPARLLHSSQRGRYCDSVSESHALHGPISRNRIHPDTRVLLQLNTCSCIGIRFLFKGSRDYLVCPGQWH